MGAMENWGLVTYRTTAVLFDEGKSDNRYKNRIAYVVAHGKLSGSEISPKHIKRKRPSVDSYLRRAGSPVVR
jgi:hypothetical protein